MNRAYIDKVAPEHEKTSCGDAEPNNARVSQTDGAGCYRCTLLTAAADPSQAADKKDLRRAAKYLSGNDSIATTEANRIAAVLRRLAAK